MKSTNQWAIGPSIELHENTLKMKPICHWAIEPSFEMHERISKNAANTSMPYLALNRQTWKNIKEWSQNINKPLDHQSNYMKAHWKMKPISQWAIEPSIKMHERISKKEINRSMDHWTINRNTWKNIKEWIGFILWCFFSSNSSVSENIIGCVSSCSMNTMNTVQKY